MNFSMSTKSSMHDIEKLSGTCSLVGGALLENAGVQLVAGVPVACMNFLCSCR